MKRTVAISVLAAVALAILGVGGWFGLRAVADARLHGAIAQFRARLAPDGRFTYATATSSPLRLGADFTDVVVSGSGLVLHASRLGLSHARENGVGHAVLRDVRIDEAGASLHIDQLEVSSLSLPRTAPETGRGASPGVATIGGARASTIAFRASAMPAVELLVAHLSYSHTASEKGGLSGNLAAQHITLLDDNAPVLTMQAAQGRSVATSTAGGPGPVDTEATFDGLVLPPLSPLGRALGQFGYLGAHGAARLVARYDAAAGTVASGPLTLTLDQIGRLTLALGLDHLAPPGRAAGDGARDMTQQSIMLRSQQMRLTGLSLVYEDAGLAKQVLRTFAARAGATPAQFRSMIAGALAARAQSMPPGPVALMQQQAIRFIDDPRRLVVTLRPPAPMPLLSLPLLRLLPPDAAAASVGLQVRAD